MNTPTTGAVLATVTLDSHWPGVDPFLFCNYHLDAYPASNGKLGPADGLQGREIGQDFSGQDGWNMYHGARVPGFPNHPHRGFETLTFVPQGLVDHADSLGATARYGRGDVQWLTAGRGIVHAEMFPLLHEDKPNPLELFQIWINLPAADKMVDPHFTMLWETEIPHVVTRDDAGRVCDVTVIAGILDGVKAATPPPNSWAARPDSEFAIWHIALDAEATWQLPAAVSPAVKRMLYVFDADTLTVDSTVVQANTGVSLRADSAVALTAGKKAARAMLMQAVPIDEPVVQYGPFVMNTEGEIRQAMYDYETTRFGGWPWPSEGPTHGDRTDRFAVHADGTEDAPTTAHRDAK